METLSFLKFWRPTQKDFQNQVSSANEFDEEDDSFFVLEFPLHGNEENIRKDGLLVADNSGRESKRYGFDDNRVHNSDKGAGDRDLHFRSPSLVLSPGDHFAIRKIIPVESTSKPQSPIAIFKSVPKFRAFSFKTKSTETNEKADKLEKPHRTELGALLMETPKREKHGSKHFSVKFGTEDGPFFVRVNSSRRTEPKSEGTTPDDSSNKLQKYLKLIKPLYVKGLKKNNDKTKFLGDFVSSSPGSSPATVLPVKKEKQGNLQAGIRVACKHLGKSRSASSMAASPPVSRRDDSLMLHNDGIQSAILHCKRSFNSPREASVLWRSTSDSSQEKLSNASSTDCSVLSRLTSVSSTSEKLLESARASSEDGIGFEPQELKAT